MDFFGLRPAVSTSSTSQPSSGIEYPSNSRFYSGGGQNTSARWTLDRRHTPDPDRLSPTFTDADYMTPMSFVPRKGTNDSGGSSSSSHRGRSRYHRGEQDNGLARSEGLGYSPLKAVNLGRTSAKYSVSPAVKQSDGVFSKLNKQIEVRDPLDPELDRYVTPTSDVNKAPSLAIVADALSTRKGRVQSGSALMVNTSTHANNSGDGYRSNLGGNFCPPSPSSSYYYNHRTGEGESRTLHRSRAVSPKKEFGSTLSSQCSVTGHTRAGSIVSNFSVDTEAPLPSSRPPRTSVQVPPQTLLADERSVDSANYVSTTYVSKDSPESRGDKKSRYRTGGATLHSSSNTVSKTNAPETREKAFRGLLRRDAKNMTVDDFRLLATVGTGTFGRVRLVKFKYSPQPLALKILKKTEIIRLKQVEHVRSEKDILQRINHPFIVNLFACFQDAAKLYMVMEFINGGELFSYLRRVGRLQNSGGRFYAAEIILAFEYLHSLDIVYRDLKPENVLLDDQGHVKITDFGFAKVVTDRTWTVCGTPEYLAPEIIQSKGHGKSVDWWALGVLIFEMLAGYPPFFDENPFGIYHKVLSGKVAFPRCIDVRAKSCVAARDWFFTHSMHCVQPCMHVSMYTMQDLIKKLLTHDRARRYGCLRGGAEDVKSHKWFKSVDWDLCIARRLRPPYVPETTSLDDTSMFDEYPDSTEGTLCPKTTAALPIRSQNDLQLTHT